MTQIRIVDGTYALLHDEQVIGVIERVNETQWGFYPLVAGEPPGEQKFVPLRYALEKAREFKPR